jgi:hypothetical protein
MGATTVGREEIRYFHSDREVIVFTTIRPLALRAAK